MLLTIDKINGNFAGEKQRPPRQAPRPKSLRLFNACFRSRVQMMRVIRVTIAPIPANIKAIQQPGITYFCGKNSISEATY